jgi:hypothetical protein
MQVYLSEIKQEFTSYIITILINVSNNILNTELELLQQSFNWNFWFS